MFKMANDNHLLMKNLPDDSIVNVTDYVRYTTDDDKEVVAISRACDQHSIPFASNVATAEVLVQGLRRGDLDWRDIVNPKKK